MADMDDITLINGDCLEVLPTLADNSVDLVFTDVPYNSNIDYGTYKDNLASADYWAWITTVVEECKRIGRMVVIKHSALKIYDWTEHIKGCRLVIWYKPFSSGFPVNGFATHFEPLWVVQGKTVKWSKDVIIQNSGAGNPECSYGPAQMPEGLARQVIDVCSTLGDTVLDCCFGTGTTGVVAVGTGRKFIGIEIDKTYFNMAQERIAKAMIEVGKVNEMPESLANSLKNSVALSLY